MKKLYFIILVLTMQVALYGVEIPERPSRFTPVTDIADILTSQEELILTEKIKRFEDTTTAQVAIVVIPSLDGDEIADLAQRWAQKWQLGIKGKDNGLLILVAIQNRKMRIEVGYGFESRITDLECKAIEDELLKPNFKQQLYYAGFDEALNELFVQIVSEKEGITAKEKKSKDDGFNLFIIFGIIIFIIIYIFRNRKTTYSGGTYSSGSTYYPGSFGSYSDSSYSDSSSSYSDYSDYSDSGGGSFGGGGSSGDW